MANVKQQAFILRIAEVHSLLERGVTNTRQVLYHFVVEIMKNLRQFLTVVRGGVAKIP